MLQNLQNFEIVISMGYASVRYESLGTSYFVSFPSRIFGGGDQVVVTRHEYARRATVADFASVRLQYLCVSRLCKDDRTNVLKQGTTSSFENWL
jgi:hypothetical protein